VREGAPSEEFGPYLVYEKLGVGGMAQVHRAVATNAPSPRPVALKRMLSHIADSEDMVKSFVREARLASYLRHENVAETYDLGKVGDVYFIAMELITGRNLRAVLKHCGATTGPMPVPIALNILNQICDALHYAHNLCDETGRPLGIIHRDVSPSNVIVSDSGIVKLIDFGIAKASGAGMQTLGGTLKGKFGYMAPEYIDGRLDARADLFAVGVIAHELLTNRPLFSGRDDIDTLTRVRDMHIDPPSKTNPLVPPEIDEIVMTALARDPDRRWQHATALRTALTTLTQRLDLVATNAHVVVWLDWAFTQAAKQDTRADTQTDGEPGSGADPSVSTARTVDLLSMNRKLALHRRGDTLDPPTTTPLGTPASIPVQRVKRPSASHPVRTPSSTSPPPYARPGFPDPSHPAAQSFRQLPSPVLPVATPAPLAMTRPPAQSPAAPRPYDPVQSAMVQREFAQRVSMPSTEAAAPARSRRRLVMAVIWIVLVAAVGTILIYFVLPLLDGR
jgi:serine/threonine protein kinase